MNRRRTGAAYEEQAARWLTEQGFEILERNFYCRQGEIDLIARDGVYLVFIEVKYRRDGRTGHPAESVGRQKQQKLIRAAQYYCLIRQIPENHPCRFDVVSILGDQVEHIQHAFECV
ncbi:MAG: YraN family protein [Lachnospiraceae bacterium]|jgi:putative endonuclease|nr:YraN family protein [Lachnospiraceae bacterium]